jgi:hypothetical protein
MSALPRKAYIRQRDYHARFVPNTDSRGCSTEKKNSGLATVNGERRQSRRLPVSLTPPAKEAAIC